jgi:predicted acylesterase/phospholipase RssA/ABC-type phosphate/phosphonate transport system substrate-binding protein
MGSGSRWQAFEQSGPSMRGMALRALFASLVALVAAPSVDLRAEEARAGDSVRIAVLAYQDKREEMQLIEQALGSLRSAAAIAEPFQVARGTYADVLHWLETGAVDMAVVTPAIFARAMEQGGTRRWEYLASVNRPSAREPSLSVAVVRNDSPIRTVDDLRGLLAHGVGRVLFVDPLSVSGALAPRFALAAERIPVVEGRIRYTHSHTNSLRVLRANGGGDTVAFVWNGVFQREGWDDLRSVEVPALGRLRMPPDALLVRADLPQRARLRTALGEQGPTSAGTVFHVESNWQAGAADVRSWLDAVGTPASDRLMRLDLEELGSLLFHEARAQAAPLRLAIVFSGGGAKCSYQIGAIRAIEEKLAQLRAETGDPSLDVSLVVGTSGGAINALPVAMGMSRTAPLCDELAAVWRSLDQRAIIRPALVVRLNMALWFASLQFLVFSWVCGYRLTDQGRTGLIRWLLCLGVGVAEVLFSHLPFDPWNALGPRPALHRLYLLLSFGAEGAGWILISTALVGLALRAAGAEDRPWPQRFRRMVRVAAMAGIIVLPLVQAWTILGHEPTLSESAGIEHTLLDRFTHLVAAKQQAEGRSSSRAADPAADSREALKVLSRRIMGEGLLVRDLVLTGSVLGERGIDLPPDLYFWASAGRTTAPPTFGMHSIALASRPELLLDALMGSGAIYPVFPARVLHDFPRTGQSTEIVDGSFAHRSPVEAAVLWGATHIILIQADPDEPVPRGSFGANVSAALTLLYDQAQLIDVRTKQQAMLFNLAPRPPHIGLLDFAGNLIDASLVKGYREVRGEFDAGGLQPPPFRKEVGVPHFVLLSSPKDASRASP